jgi:dihydrofolate synthase/folylpolyglutamate synthase
LPGRYQALNAALAIAMLRHQSLLEVPPSALHAAMGWTHWPARLQRLDQGPLVDLLPDGSDLWIDGGHNPSAARLVASHAEKTWDDGLPLTLLFASLKTKNAAATLSPFRGIASDIRTLPIPGHDSRDPADLAKMALAMGFTASPHQSIVEALGAIATPSRVLVFGSLYLAGEALSLDGTLPD